MFTIDEIRIEGEEDGFHLTIYTDDSGVEGAISESFRFRIGLPDQFHAEVERTIGAWLAEGEAARMTMPVRTISAYDISDPKHPDYHDTMSAIHDNREGK